MDINKALTYVMDDDRWITKLLIAIVMIFLSFFIVPIFFLYGYLVQIIRNVMDGVENPLPEWDNWGGLFKDGLSLFVAGIVYTLPIWILMFCSFLFFIPAMGSSGDAAEVLAGVGVFAMFIMMCLVFIFAIALMLIGPAIAIQYARTDSLSACFQFGEVIGIARDNIGDIVIALVVVFAVGFVLSLVGIIPILGMLVILAGNAYILFVTGHMYGQIGAKAGGGSSKEKEFDAVM